MQQLVVLCQSESFSLEAFLERLEYKSPSFFWTAETDWVLGYEPHPHCLFDIYHTENSIRCNFTHERLPSLENYVSLLSESEQQRLSEHDRLLFLGLTESHHEDPFERMRILLSVAYCAVESGGQAVFVPGSEQMILPEHFLALEPDHYTAENFAILLRSGLLVRDQEVLTLATFGLHLFQLPDILVHFPLAQGELELKLHHCKAFLDDFPRSMLIARGQAAPDSAFQVQDEGGRSTFRLQDTSQHESSHPSAISCQSFVCE